MCARSQFDFEHRGGPVELVGQRLVGQRQDLHFTHFDQHHSVHEIPTPQTTTHQIAGKSRLVTLTRSTDLVTKGTRRRRRRRPTNRLLSTFLTARYSVPTRNVQEFAQKP